MGYDFHLVQFTKTSQTYKKYYNIRVSKLVDFLIPFQCKYTQNSASFLHKSAHEEFNIICISEQKS